MSTLLEKPISVNRILLTSIDHAKAIEDPARAKIIQMLYNRNLNAEQITLQLKKYGHKKALTTIRHHLDILKESGLIEYDDSEVLYLGQNEVLKGTAKNQYIIFNSSTNLFKYLDTEKYKKVVTYEERMEQSNMEGDNAVN